MGYYNLLPITFLWTLPITSLVLRCDAIDVIVVKDIESAGPFSIMLVLLGIKRPDFVQERSELQRASTRRLRSF